MAKDWKYQIRLVLAQPFAELARKTPEDRMLETLATVLEKNRATLSCQFDAFANYVAMAQCEGIDKYPLYAWTKAIIENPVKQQKYKSAFTLYVGGEEVYEKIYADALEADLKPLVGGDMIKNMTKHDTNPANNPQMPEKYRPTTSFT